VIVSSPWSRLAPSAEERDSTSIQMADSIPDDDAPGMHKFSCVLCHKRKVKCDRMEPCGYCNRHNDTCKIISGVLEVNQHADARDYIKVSTKLPRRPSEGRKKARVIMQIYLRGFNEQKTSCGMSFHPTNSTASSRPRRQSPVRFLDARPVRHLLHSQVLWSRSDRHLMGG
jgi:hypothetical protein